MFDRMMETKLTGGLRGFSSFSLSIAVAGHLAVVVALASVSYLIVEKVRDPDVPLVFIPPPVRVFFESLAPSPRPPEGDTPAAPRGGGALRFEPRPRAVAPTRFFNKPPLTP